MRQKRALFLLTPMLCTGNFSLGDKVVEFETAGNIWLPQRSRLQPHLFQPASGTPAVAPPAGGAAAAMPPLAPPAPHAGKLPGKVTERLALILQVDMILGHTGDLMR